MNETNEIGDDKMNNIIHSLHNRNDQLMNTIAMSPDGGNMMERCSIGMFGLTLGIWLGDTFVRAKGFDLKNKQR